jgi:hypothetical protein
VVERVDESLKADIMHWAAFYVSVSDMDLDWFNELTLYGCP